MIAALEREVAPLKKRFRSRKQGSEQFSIFENEEVSLICAGIGGKHAAAAARWSISRLNPELVMSVGFAGALDAGGAVGDVLTPATVIDGGTGEAFPTTAGNGVLVTVSGVLAGEEKRNLATRFHATAVDMEGAAVARVARESGVRFSAVKAISDPVDFAMPPLERFVNEAGEFQHVKLLAYAAVRPWLWTVLMRLGTNSEKASSQLCAWLENQISRDFQDIMSVSEKRNTVPQ